jgi:membrane associated rhomboid family serine protease
MDSVSSSVVIIAATCVVSFLAFGSRKLLEAMVFWPPAISRERDYSRFLTYGFVHANGAHLLFNMLTLYFFARPMEAFINAHLGPYGFALFYLLGLVGSILPTYLRHRDDEKYVSLGASGAVSAVIFAYILLRPWAMLGVFFAIPMPAILYAVLYLGYTIWMDLKRSDRVNHSAHLWGAIYGIVFLIVMEPRVIDVFLDQLAHPRFMM